MNEGLTIYSDPDTLELYCALCGIKILNKTWWKEIHLKFHQGFKQSSIIKKVFVPNRKKHVSRPTVQTVEDENTTEDDGEVGYASALSEEEKIERSRPKVILKDEAELKEKLLNHEYE